MGKTEIKIKGDVGNFLAGDHSSQNIVQLNATDMAEGRELVLNLSRELSNQGLKQKANELNAIAHESDDQIFLEKTKGVVNDLDAPLSVSASVIGIVAQIMSWMPGA